MRFSMVRILFVVQLPPPVHGVALMNELIVKSPLIQESFRERHINLGTSNQIKDIGKFSPAKLLLSVRCLASIIKHLLFFRPHLVYFTPSPTGFAFYRDALYISMINFFPARLVLHLHGQGIQAGARDSRLFRWLCKRMFRKAHVIFLSEGLKKDAIEFVQRPPFVVNNGLADDVIPPVRPPEERPLRILYLSNYVRSKGILDLVDALEIVARTHRSFHCDLVGKPFDVSTEFLAGYIQQKGLAEVISIRGALYGKEKTRFLENADIFTLPSFNDAFPLVILEAMKFGLPVISTYEGGIPDIIDDSVTGLLIPKRDIKALAAKLLFLLEHPEERQRLGNAARKKFLEKFTLSDFERNMHEVFRQVVQQK
ncbi:MAG TPA: glycosyltransferase family 4 protein [Puia sp.]|nr:glycosyltransferase family 4 protein [Puia sp.]